MAEKGRQQERDPLRSDDSFSPLGSAIPGADPSRSGLYLHGRRLLGERACTVIAMAEQRGVPTDEIRGSIDCVINEGGDVNDLAGLLLHGGEYW